LQRFPRFNASIDLENERIVYKNYYNIDIKDTSIYDIVIDSSSKSPEEIVEIIIKKVMS